MENKRIFSTKPFEKQTSRDLIEAAKLNKVCIVEGLLNTNRFLVYDFDNVSFKSFQPPHS